MCDKSLSMRICFPSFVKDTDLRVKVQLNQPLFCVCLYLRFSLVAMLSLLCKPARTLVTHTISYKHPTPFVCLGGSVLPSFSLSRRWVGAAVPGLAHFTLYILYQAITLKTLREVLTLKHTI